MQNHIFRPCSTFPPPSVSDPRCRIQLPYIEGSPDAKCFATRTGYPFLPVPVHPTPAHCPVTTCLRPNARGTWSCAQRWIIRSGPSSQTQRTKCLVLVNPTLAGAGGRNDAWYRRSNPFGSLRTGILPAVQHLVSSGSFRRRVHVGVLIPSWNLTSSSVGVGPAILSHSSKALRLLRNCSGATCI